MSRHRNVRNLDYDDYADDYEYGMSYEEETAMSPSMREFMYRRRESEEGYNEEEDYYYDEKERYDEGGEEEGRRKGSRSGVSPRKSVILNGLSEAERGLLFSGMDYVGSVVGYDSFPEEEVMRLLVKYRFEAEKVLAVLLGDAKEEEVGAKEEKKKREEEIPFAAASSSSSVSVSTSKVEKKKEKDDIVLGKRAGGGTSEASKGESQGTKKPGVGKKAAKAAKYAEKEANSGSNIDFDMAAMGIGPKTPIDTKLKQRLADPGGGSSGGGSGRSSTNVSPKISSPKVKRKNIDVKEAYRKRQGQHVHLNLVVIGHVDAGKSTMMGHLLYLLGEVDKRSMHRYENDSKKMGKSSFAFAWVLDETESERSRGVTVDVGTSYFETPTKKVTLLDAPGHKDFIPNMITGAAQADVGILVVNAVTGEFEAGFDSGGQTREHGLLARSLGVNQLIVAVNKLDMVNWSQPRFEDIVSSLKPFLKQIGFKSKNVSFIPCSGLTGVNLVKNEEAELKKWYTGKTLIEQIDCFEEPVRNVDLPFRFSVGDIYKGPTGGLWVSGKTESGHIQIGDNVAIMPTKANPEFGTVKNIEMRNEPVDWVASGDSASLQLVGVDPACINTGYILCAPENPIPVAIKIRARVIVFDIDIPLTKGNPVVFHTQCLDEPAIVSKLVSLLNKTTGEVIKDRPRALPSGCTAIVEIKLHRLVCLELYQDNKTLGRFMLRAGSQTVAAGIVTDILK
eukprot:Nk52_evm22s281 gene=Nk52_evmTU22s281